MSNIQIISERTNAVRQDKFKGDFDSSLQASLPWVKSVSESFEINGWEVVKQADNVPFKSKNTYKRYADIRVLIPNVIEFSVECKEVARTYKWEIQGLPQIYIEKIKVVPNLYIVWKDNLEMVKKRAENRRVGEKQIINELEKDGFCKIVNGEVVFVPYGEELNFLMLPEHRDFEREPWLFCKWSGKYYGEKQFLWKIPAMLTLPRLIEKINQKYKN